MRFLGLGQRLVGSLTCRSNGRWGCWGIEGWSSCHRRCGIWPTRSRIVSRG